MLALSICRNSTNKTGYLFTYIKCKIEYPIFNLVIIFQFFKIFPLPFLKKGIDFPCLSFVAS